MRTDPCLCTVAEARGLAFVLARSDVPAPMYDKIFSMASMGAIMALMTFAMLIVKKSFLKDGQEMYSESRKRI